MIESIIRRPNSVVRGSIKWSIVWLNFEKAIRMSVGLIQVALVARYLGASLYGELSAAAAIVAMVSGPAGLGLEVVLLRKIVAEPARAGKELSTAIALRLGVGAIVIGCLSTVGFLVYSHPLNYLIFISSLVCIVQAPCVIECWYRSIVSAGAPAIAQISGTLIGLGWRVLAVRLGSSVGWFAAASAIEIFVSTVVLLIAYFISNSPPLSRPSLSSAKALIKECWPLVLASISAALFLRIDVITLRTLAGQKETGLYTAALRMVELVSLLPLSLITSTTPIFLKIYLEDKQHFYNIFSGLASLLFWLGTALATVLSILGPFFVVRIYGAEFAGSGKILQLLSWNLVPCSVAITWGIYWLAERRQLAMSLLTFFGAAVLYIICMGLVPLLGAKGAATGAIVAQSAPFIILSIMPSTRKIMTQIASRILHPFRSLGLVYRFINESTHL